MVFYCYFNACYSSESTKIKLVVLEDVVRTDNAIKLVVLEEVVRCDEIRPEIRNALNRAGNLWLMRVYED